MVLRAENEKELQALVPGIPSQLWGFHLEINKNKPLVGNMEANDVGAKHPLGTVHMARDLLGYAVIPVGLGPGYGLRHSIPLKPFSREVAICSDSPSHCVEVLDLSNPISH